MSRKLITSLLILIIAGVAAGVAFGWYKNLMPKNETAMEHALKHQDPSYYCPMHPQVTSDEPGRCPICTMDLVPFVNAGKKAEPKIIFYRHPMNPEITADTPQKDSMGMDFIPVYEDAITDPSVITISPAVINNLGVRTAQVERKTLSRRINTVGYVSPNESLIGHVHIRTDGWVENLTVDTVGDRVKKGQLLFTLYSPTLVNAQDEYIKALERKNERLINASKHKLKSLGISPSQINELTKNREVQRTISIFSHHDGVVTALMIREGMYVEPSTETISIVDLSNVWLQAEVFEQQASWIEVDQKAEATISSSSDRTWSGAVDYIYPVLDPITRTLKVRLKFDNPDEVLKPNMFAHVNIYSSPRENILVAPREAVIRDGNSERVIMALGEGKFSQRQIRTGIESEGQVEIVDGLKEGEMIVVSAQFLIDSEASLKASFQRMQTTPEESVDSMEMTP
jgi:Cu(I)/Ag(I) efflux system membrane fusion protein